jgi:hypothetical protein
MAGRGRSLMISDGLLDESMEPGIFKRNHEMNKRKRARQLGEYMLHLKPFFRKMRAVRITSERIKAYIVKRQNYGAASATINRELGCLKRMFRLGFEQTPQLVGHVPYIPMLKEPNLRSGFFEYEDFLALRMEDCSLQRRQITWIEGELYLRAQDTKTNTRGCSFSQAIFIESCGRGRPGVTTSGPPARESAIEEGFACRP